MNMTSHNIKIQHEKFGILLNETFVNGTQFKLFLKMIQGSIELKNDLDADNYFRNVKQESTNELASQQISGHSTLLPHRSASFQEVLHLAPTH